MKYIKTFENINEPESGDYVLCYSDKDETYYSGILINLNYNSVHPYYISIKELDGFNFSFPKKELIFWTKDKEELELQLNVLKYNL